MAIPFKQTTSRDALLSSYSLIPRLRMYCLILTIQVLLSADLSADIETDEREVASGSVGGQLIASALLGSGGSFSSQPFNIIFMDGLSTSSPVLVHVWGFSSTTCA